MSLLKFTPSDEFEFNMTRFKSSSLYLKIDNISQERVAFKLKTNNPAAYLVKPSMGVLEPMASCKLEIVCQAMPEIKSETNDKFLIKACVTRAEITNSDKDKINAALEDRSLGHQETKLNVSHNEGIQHGGSTGAVPEKSASPRNGSAAVDDATIADLRAQIRTLQERLNTPTTAVAATKSKFNFIPILVALILGVILGYKL